MFNEWLEEIELEPNEDDLETWELDRVFEDLAELMREEYEAADFDDEEQDEYWNDYDPEDELECIDSEDLEITFPKDWHADSYNN